MMSLTVMIVAPRQPLPEILRALAATGALHLHMVCNCHEAAAEIALAPTRWMGLLIDAHWLTRHELEMMNVIKRHAALPIWTLPALNHPKPGHDLRFLPWPEALRAFAQLPQRLNTPQLPEGNNTIFIDSKRIPSPPDNPDAKPTEIPLASGVAARYDGVEIPVLSRSEIEALLGTEE